MNNRYRLLLAILLFAFACNEAEENITPPKLLIKVDQNVDGSICNNGGSRLALGDDVNNNDLLEEEEITTYTTFCDDDNGDRILINLDKITCGDTDEGYRILIGYDFDGDNLFKAEQELFPSFEICGNIDLDNYIIRSSEISLGGGVCGKEYLIEIGHDINLNEILDVDEVEHSSSFYNRLVMEDNTINLTLSDSDYEAIAQAYSNINPAGAQSMLIYKNFDIMNLWSYEEVSEAISGRLMEIGSKVDCQRYLVTCEVYPPSQMVFAYIYDEGLETFISPN